MTYDDTVYLYYYNLFDTLTGCANIINGIDNMNYHSPRIYYYNFFFFVKTVPNKTFKCRNNFNDFCYLVCVHVLSAAISSVQSFDFDKIGVNIIKIVGEDLKTEYNCIEKRGSDV